MDRIAANQAVFCFGLLDADVVLPTIVFPLGHKSEDTRYPHAQDPREPRSVNAAAIPGRLARAILSADFAL